MTKSRTLRKAGAVALSLAMALSIAGTTPAQAASKVKLSSKKGTIKVNKTKTVTIKNTKKSNIKKVKFTYSKKKIAKATRKGLKITVKGLKAGKTTITAKITLKKAVAGKKSYSLKYTATVKKATPAPTAEVPTTAITLDKAEAEVVAGQSITLTATKTPANSTDPIEWTSDKPEIATVSAGVVTGVKAGEAVITAKAGEFTATCKVTVKAAEVIAKLVTVKQTAANGFEATFDVDASKLVNKEDITVESADKKTTLKVNSITFSADGTTANVVTAANFVNDVEYNVTYKETTANFVAKVGAVASIVISTTTAEQNVKTDIKYQLFDANNIDVTSATDLSTTVNISVTGSYGDVDKTATAPNITMIKVGDEATVKVKYNSNAPGAQDIIATQTIKCIEASPTVGTLVFAQTGNTNTRSGAAKFYIDSVKSDKVSLSEGGAAANNVYFYANDGKGAAISYDSYKVTSSDDEIATADLTVKKGKFGQLTVTPVKQGSATINITATKNGKDTPYSIPVLVSKPGAASSMTLTTSDSTLSNAFDEDYKGTARAFIYDAAGNLVEAPKGVTFTLKDNGKENGNKKVDANATGDAGKGFGLYDAGGIDVDGIVDRAKADHVAFNATANAGAYVCAFEAWGAKEDTYTITANADIAGGDSLERSTNVSVKAIPADAWASGTGAAMTYTIEQARSTVDESKQGSADTNTVRLKAVIGDLFIGYVREDSNGKGAIGSGTTAGSAAVAGTWTFTITGAADTDTITVAGVTTTLTTPASDTAAAAAVAASTYTGTDYTVTSSGTTVTVTEKAGKEGTCSAPVVSKTGSVTLSAVTAGTTGHAAVPAGPAIKATNTIENIKFGVRYGSKYATATTGNVNLYDSANNITGNGVDTLGTAPIDTKVVINTVNWGAAGGPVYCPDDDSLDTTFAKGGSYTVYYTYDEAGKTGTQEKTNAFNVVNTYVIPKATITKRNLGVSPTVNKAKEVIVTNVDLNNNTSSHESVVDLCTSNGSTATPASDKLEIKYVKVVENFGGQDVNFLVSQTATFKK